MDLKKMKSFQFNKNSFDFKKIKDSFWDFLLDKFGVIFMSIFIIASMLGGVIIYKYLYASDWSEDQKNAYRFEVEENEPPFDLDKFNSVVEKIRERKEIKTGNAEVSRDIFGTTE